MSASSSASASSLSAPASSLPSSLPSSFFRARESASKESTGVLLVATSLEMTGEFPASLRLRLSVTFHFCEESSTAIISLAALSWLFSIRVSEVEEMSISFAKSAKGNNAVSVRVVHFIKVHGNVEKSFLKFLGMGSVSWFFYLWKTIGSIVKLWLVLPSFWWIRRITAISCVMNPRPMNARTELLRVAAPWWCGIAPRHATWVACTVMPVPRLLSTRTNWPTKKAWR